MEKNYRALVSRTTSGFIWNVSNHSLNHGGDDERLDCQ